MSDIGGFISAPIKLAAIINNCRSSKNTAKQEEEGNVKRTRDKNNNLLLKEETSSMIMRTSRRRQLNENNNKSMTYLCSRRINNLAASYSSSQFSLINISLICVLIHLLIIPQFGASNLMIGPSSTRQRQQQQQQQQQQQESLLRHQTHYMNIVPSTHFNYNEGRQLNSAQNEHTNDLSPATNNDYSSSADNKNNDGSSHIYKRSSALISSPGAGFGVGVGAHYLPLIGSMANHNGGGPLNPLRRRMMSDSSLAQQQQVSAASMRWLPPPQQAMNSEQEQQQQQQLVDIMATSGSEQHLIDHQPEARSVQQAANIKPQHRQRRPEHEEAELLRQKQHIQYHDQWPSVAGKCHKRTLNFCASVLPFNTTTFPNIIGDTNRFEVKRSLPFFGFLAKSSCNKRLDELLCLLLEPPCGPQSGAAIPPCKKFCRLALEGCNEYIPATLAMSSVFDCRQYPDSNDPNVCINLAQGSKCAQDEFKCPDKTCIPRNWLCDGVRDCIFAADEANCTALTGIGLQTSVCSTEEFKCDGKCVPKAWKCDGERDCLDGSDEESCDQRPRCGPDRFKCADGNGCLPKRWVCDGKAECRDGSDEMNCEEQECSENDFKCDNGICIPKLWRCDHQFDCKDGSDERSCVYTQSTTSTSTTTTTQQPPITTTTMRQQPEDSTNYYLNTTYSLSSTTTTTTDQSAQPQTTTQNSKQVANQQPQQQQQVTGDGEEAQPTIVASASSSSNQVLDLNPLNYYSGESQPSIGGVKSIGREQLELNVNDDVSRIIKQDLASTSSPEIAIMTNSSQQDHQSSSTTEASISSQKQQQRQTSKELNKFDYDIIQSSSSPSTSAANLIQFADLMVNSNEMMATNRQVAPASKSQQQVLLTQIDYSPQQQQQQQAASSGRQVTNPSSIPQQQQQVSFAAHQQKQQQQQQRQVQQGGRTFNPAQVPPSKDHERVPIYRSLFKTLKHGQGRLAAASAAAQHRAQGAGVGGSAHHRRRRGDRHQLSASSVAPPAVVSPTIIVDDLAQNSGNRFPPHWNPSSPTPTNYIEQQQQQQSNPIHQPGKIVMKQVANSGQGNHTRTHHGVASYLQLLNSRYNLRLPRVSPMPLS